MRALWSDDHVDFDGEFASFAGASVNPAGGSDRPDLHRRPQHRRGPTGRTSGDGSSPPRRHRRAGRHHAPDRGRRRSGPRRITVSTGSAGVFGDDPAGAVEELAAKGVDRVIVPAFAFTDTADTLAAFGERVTPCTADPPDRDRPDRDRPDRDRPDRDRPVRTRPGLSRRLPAPTGTGSSPVRRPVEPCRWVSPPAARCRCCRPVRSPRRPAPTATTRWSPTCAP